LSETVLFSFVRDAHEYTELRPNVMDIKEHAYKTLGMDFA
jgi:hypothetical protein